MTCVLSKAPLNIPNKSTNICVEKCSLYFNYGQSSLSIKNNGDHLSLGYDASTTNVRYNTNKMEVSDIKIFTPSLHTYDGVRTDAEMIIVHSGFGKNLLVCIPMKSGESSGGATSAFSQIITETSGRIANSGDSTSLNSLTWSLNDFVPNKKPMYVYTSNLPYSPCSGVYDILVFSQKDYYIPISAKIIKKLQGSGKIPGLISKQQYAIKSGPTIFYNKNGAVNSNFSGDDDDIYIECQPTGTEGEVLFKKNVTSLDSTTGGGGTTVEGEKNKMPTINDIVTNPAFGVLTGIIAAYILYKIGEVAYKKFKKGGGD